MFDEAEWMQLVQKLSELTKGGVLKWRMDGAHADIRAKVGSYTYSVGSVDADERPPYFLDVRRDGNLDAFGRLVSEPVEPNRPLMAAEVLVNLYGEAVRSATGAPQQFKQMMDDLDNLSKLPPS